MSLIKNSNVSQVAESLVQDTNFKDDAGFKQFEGKHLKKLYALDKSEAQSIMRMHATRGTNFGEMTGFTYKGRAGKKGFSVQPQSFRQHFKLKSQGYSDEFNDDYDSLMQDMPEKSVVKYRDAHDIYIEEEDMQVEKGRPSPNQTQ